MTVERKVLEFCDDFNRAQVFTTTPGQNGWTIKDTSSSGTPTYLVATGDGGGAVLTLANTSEAEIVTLFHNDVLVFDIRTIQRVEMIAKVSGIDAATTLTFGVASAQNDNDDSVAVNAWFRMEGSVSTTAVVVETDDGTVDNNDKATGATLASTFKHFVIDFTNGLADIRFYIDREPVALATTFSMAAVAAGQNVQPFVQLQKASGTGVPSITLKRFRILYQETTGA